MLALAPDPADGADRYGRNHGLLFASCTDDLDGGRSAAVVLLALGVAGFISNPSEQDQA